MDDFNAPECIPSLNLAKSRADSPVLVRLRSFLSEFSQIRLRVVVLLFRQNKGSRGKGLVLFFCFVFLPQISQLSSSEVLPDSSDVSFYQLLFFFLTCLMVPAGEIMDWDTAKTIGAETNKPK